MDRGIIYPGQIPLETDLLFAQKSSMVGLAKLAAAMFGTSTIVNGLAVAPNSPAALNVLVGPGEVYALVNIDGTAYSSIAADTTHQILKQGISLDTLTVSCATPGTAGFSINYLIQATFSEVDGTPVALPYYNASNPATAYSGPANSGTAQNTRRAGTVVVSAKAGTAATTGTQTTPAPDAGYVGIAVVTVANGQTTITSGNITAYSSAPVMPSSGMIIGGFQQDLFNTAKAGGTSDAITAAFAPAITSTTLASGIVTVTVYPTAANATTTPTFTPNSGVISPATIVKGNNQSLATGDIAGANHPIVLMWNPAATNWVLLNPATGVNPGTLPGFRNKIINGGMAVDQRNAGAAQTFTAAAALAYCVDRWYGYCTGANVNGQRVAGSGANQYRYQFTGAASVTGIGFGQRIEKLNSIDLAGSTATLSVDLANSLLTTVNWTAYYANTDDTFGSLASPTRTQIATGSFTVNSAVTRYSTPISIPAGATTGIEVVFSVGAQTSGTWVIGNVQLEAGSSASAFERRPIATELAACQRYFEKIGGDATGDITIWNSSNAGQGAYEVIRMAPKRAIPTAAVVGTWGIVGSSSQPSIAAAGTNALSVTVNGSGGGTSAVQSSTTAYLTSSAEL